MKERPAVPVALTQDASVLVPPPTSIPVDGEPDDARAGHQSRHDRNRVERGDRLSPVMKEIRDAEEQEIGEWLATLGTEGAFRVQVKRVKPEHFEGHDIAGHLETYEHTIDESFLKRTYGGGTYNLKVTRKTEDGSFKFQKGLHRTVTISGDPIVIGVTQKPPVESETVAKQALNMVKEMADKKGASEVHPSVQILIDEMRARDADQRAEIAALRTQLVEVPRRESDPIKDKLLGTLLDGQSGHVTALRSTHESEIRQLKDQARDLEKQLRDQHDREVTSMRDRHDRDIRSLQDAHLREVTNLRSSFDTSLTSARTAAEAARAAETSSNALQVSLLTRDLARAERELTELRTEIRELRDKKDKPLIEQVSDIKKLREALTDGESESDGKSAFDRIAEVATSPAAGEIAQAVMSRLRPAAAPVVEPARAVAVVPSRKVVQVRGERFIAITNASGDINLVPARKKPTVVAGPDGSTIEAPAVDPQVLRDVVGFMEKAYEGKQDALIFAQGARHLVPDEILSWIRNHDTENTSGVDLLLSRVAQLPSSSSLASLGGRNWVRKVGKALIGANAE